MKKHILVNYMEISVNHYYKSVTGRFPDICTCEKCELDVKAIALNNLVPHYVVSEMGELWLKIDEMKIQFEVDIVKAITEAVKIVGNNPRHDPKISIVGNIALIGMMGSGKTTIMKKLNEIIGYTTFDTDVAIVEQVGMSISQIFYEMGEDYFRKYEHEIVSEISKKSGCVISTGGGVIGNRDNIDALKKNGKIVYLKASPEELSKRLINEAASRPLIAGYAKDENTLIQRISELLAQRADEYDEAADIIIDTDGKSPYQITCEIIEKVK